MAKKNLNPADAYRKAQRKKELKKNKADRIKARDLALVKKDTWDLEDEIAKLEEAKNPAEQSRLADLKAELEKINRKKAEYVAEHPEHRRLVYRPRRKEGDAPADEIVLPKRRLFDKKGLPIHPERSIYYDPVMNPFGVAPPGMPYMERAPLPGEVWTDEESDGDDDDIVMPAGPPPGKEDEDYDVDDIPMPDGRPPGQSAEASTSSPPPLPPLPPGPPPVLTPSGVTTPGVNVPPPPPPPPGIPSNASWSQGLPPFPPTLPPGFPGASFPPPPPPPPGFPVAGVPPPPMPNFAPTGLPSQSLPPPPPGFFPRGSQSASSMQDPLSSIPHKTFQAHHNDRPLAPPHPSLPPKPAQAVVPLPSTLPAKPTVGQPVTAHAAAAATISAEPQLRDLKKEATAFVPTALKRKKPGASASSSKVNAAPGVEEDDNQEPVGPARPDLLSALKDQFGPAPSATPSNAQKKGEKRKDDYEKFMEEMGDILGPTSK
ncbi:putative WW domain binding protein 11 [Lyophyllum shimeji]|uniref:WW domain binding protein 11 n=1 Tax=Lyophyllum shimeji TaxID=47721 RepID=A0A9P3UJU4_LYOSH|nr:putative WW domain binding protein 11 [Lyophyllum shimeji]